MFRMEGLLKHLMGLVHTPAKPKAPPIRLLKDLCGIISPELEPKLIGELRQAAWRHQTVLKSARKILLVEVHWYLGKNKKHTLENAYLAVFKPFGKSLELPEKITVETNSFGQLEVPIEIYDLRLSKVG